jgi:hypothetical protein
LLVFVSHSALNQALRLIQRETEADLVPLLVQIMGSYKTFAFRIILAKYLVEVGSWGVPSPESFSGISNFVFIHSPDEVIASVGIHGLSLVSEEPFVHFRINSRLTAFVTIIHGVDLSLSGEEGELSSVLGWVSGKSFVVPFQIFELGFSGSRHQDRGFRFFAFADVEFTWGFVTGAFVILILVFRVQPPAWNSHLLFECSRWWHSLVDRLGHCSKIWELKTWLKVIHLI